MEIQTDLEPQNNVISPRSFRAFLAACGLAGVACLILYFAAPFVLFPFPAANATSAQLLASVSQYQTYYLLAAWLQGTGSLLTVVFILGLVYLAKAWTRFSGWITMLAAVIVVSLSLSEGNYFLDVVQAISNGHPDAALTSFDLSFVFLHSFFIAPSLLLPLAFVLRPTSLLPKYLWKWALGIGIIFESIGLPGLFFSQIGLLVIVVLIVQEIWIVTAAATLALRVPQEHSQIFAKIEKAN